uniref:Uncharacterized protein n=1 Tax=Mucochytrium quahogii TaxID=96639 RepID=A0A7S2RW61_9STRA|mmetsp:Transcript_6151/g.9617  ORF Transcript_6151/g.9617 Transcript_6151/m.9617 type:complete len:581 (+) Transcript_6151:40-1782(+)
MKASRVPTRLMQFVLLGVVVFSFAHLSGYYFSNFSTGANEAKEEARLMLKGVLGELEESKALSDSLSRRISELTKALAEAKESQGEANETRPRKDSNEELRKAKEDLLEFTRKDVELRTKLTGLKQQLREATGEIKSLKAIKKDDVAKDLRLRMDAQLWADEAIFTKSDKYDCRGPPSEGETNYNPMWDELRGGNPKASLCGCLRDFEEVEENCGTDSVLKASDNAYNECDVIWLVVVGDSTAQMFFHVFSNLLDTLGFATKRFKPKASPPNQRKNILDKERVAAKSSTGRLQYANSYGEEDIAFEKRGLPTVLLSFRRIHGIGASKWLAMLEAPHKQFSAVQRHGWQISPVLDEPAFIDTGSQLMDVAPATCKFEGPDKIYPDIFIAGTALWDTFYDSNMKHRSEVQRCDFKIPSSETAKNLYTKRLPTLFNKVCKNLPNSFVWRASNIPPRNIVSWKGKEHDGFNDNHKNEYPLTSFFNSEAKKTAERTGIRFYDFEETHANLGYPGIDRVHPHDHAVLAGLRDMLEPGFVPGLCDRSNEKQKRICLDQMAALREIAQNKSIAKQKEFNSHDFSRPKK